MVVQASCMTLVTVHNISDIIQTNELFTISLPRDSDIVLYQVHPGYYQEVSLLPFICVPCKRNSKVSSFIYNIALIIIISLLLAYQLLTKKR